MDRSDEITRLIFQDDFEGARRLIEIELESDPGSHWQITRLSLTYYEQRDYIRALELTTRALEIAPNCPLALWDHAGALEMLNCPQEAIAVYEGLLDRGVDDLAHGECGEGRAMARGLLSDCLYRMCGCYRALGQNSRAVDCLMRGLQLRGPGCRSIYHISKLRHELSGLEELERELPMT